MSAEIRTLLTVIVFLAIALGLIVAALGLLLPQVRLRDRWTATFMLFGASGALMTAWRFGEA